MQVIAHTAYTIPDRSPIRVDAGEEVEVGERDVELPEFVFVTTADGSGWVPARSAPPRRTWPKCQNPQKRHL